MKEMNRRGFLKGVGLGGAALCGCGGMPRAAGAEPERPNVLWLSAEDISPLLGCYGDHFACTPNLDRLASEGIRYDRAYAHAPVCSRSRSGMITGVYPSTLGTHQHRSHATLPPNVRCFTEYLRQAGYYCSNNDKADSTVVMFWGDHGTGIVRGKRWLYESGTRIPLIIRFPEKFQRLAPAPPGSVETRLVNFIDLAPTLLTLVGVPVPGHMQGEAFLGTQEGPRREYIFFIRDRMDEAYDCIRSVRGERFRYIRNFYSHIPYDQYNQYLYKERTAQAWRRLAHSLNGPAALFMRPEKPREELFDTEADPDEVHDLAKDPDHQPTLPAMRGRMSEWMIRTHDLGLLDEAEMYRRAEGRPAMELGNNPKAYDLPRILETANLPLV